MSMPSRIELAENSLTAVDNIQHLLSRLKNDIEQIEDDIIENKATPEQVRKNALDYSFDIIEKCIIVKIAMEDLVFRR